MSIDFIKKIVKKNRFLFYVFLKFLWSPNKESIAGKIESKLGKNKKNKCLQVGANDGKINDPIHRLILKYNWRVVFIEPQKFVFDILQNETYLNHTNKLFYNKAVSNHNGYQTMYSIGFSNSRWAHGLSSFLKSSIINAYNSGYVAKCANDHNEIIPEDKKLWIKETQTQCITFSTLLDEIEDFIDYELDILLIDVEGFDYEILKMYPFDRLKPKLVIFEFHHLNKSDFDLACELLKNKNYSIELVGNDMLAHLNL